MHFHGSIQELINFVVTVRSSTWYLTRLLVYMNCVIPLCMVISLCYSVDKPDKKSGGFGMGNLWQTREAHKGFWWGTGEKETTWKI